MGQLMEKDDEDDLKEYEVELADSVLLALLAISSKEDALKVRRRLLMLKVAPAMGPVYNPIYESAMPDHEVRATFTGHYGIYYTIDEASSKVAVEYLEDCRRNPLEKFS